MTDKSYTPSNQQFHAAACANCCAVENSEVKLLTCSQCQLVSYCSKSCQRNDWQLHRALCIVNKISDSKNVFESAQKLFLERGASSWLDIREELALAAGINLCRSLNVRERQMFLFPKVCEVCKEAKPSLLKSCQRCTSVFYCSEGHRIQDESIHYHWCESYQLWLELYTLEAHHGMLTPHIPADIDIEYVKLPKDIKTLLDAQMELDPEKVFDYRYVILAAERLTFPLSLLYALEKVGIGVEKKAVETVADLRVHIIGAELLTEIVGIVRWEYLLHRLPSLKQLHIVFIGPEVFSSVLPEDERSVGEHFGADNSSERCDSCIEKGRIVMHEGVAMTYHEFIESAHYSKPDVIIAFNCGFHASMDTTNDSWRKSLALIANSTLPLIFTSYTREESKKDLQAILKANALVKIEIDRHVNPFRGMRPLRCHIREDGDQIFFNNYYLTSVRGV